MTRLNLVLLVAVLASALLLVRMQYESRRLYAEIDKVEKAGGEVWLEITRAPR